MVSQPFLYICVGQYTIKDLTTVRCFPDFHEIGVEPMYTR